MKDLKINIDYNVLEYFMSIRIVNKNSGRTIIIKNQDDMNNLDTSVSSVNDNDREFTLTAKDTDFDSAYQNDTNLGNLPGNVFSDLKNRRAYKRNNVNSDMFDFDSFQDDDANHYIAVSQYPLSDEIKSGEDPTNVDAPIMKFKDLDDQVPNTIAPEDSEFSLDDYDGQGNDEDDQGQSDANPFASEEDGEGEPSEFEGLIRTVRGACLVYKRKSQDGTYEELWIYNVGDDLKKETAIRKSILSGTDIDPNTQMSDDGQQRAKTISMGNIQYLQISGMVQ
jgi:hypothetical protein